MMQSWTAIATLANQLSYTVKRSQPSPRNPRWNASRTLVHAPFVQEPLPRTSREYCRSIHHHRYRLQTLSLNRLPYRRSESHVDRLVQSKVRILLYSGHDPRVMLTAGLSSCVKKFGDVDLSSGKNMYMSIRHGTANKTATPPSVAPPRRRSTISPRASPPNSSNLPCQAPPMSHSARSSPRLRKPSTASPTPRRYRKCSPSHPRS